MRKLRLQWFVMTIVFCIFSPVAFPNTQYQITDLGAGSAWGINNASQVVGTFGLWENGNITFLGGTGKCINTQGQVVIQNGDNSSLWEKGTIVSIGGYANGINDFGVVVGRDGFNAWKWDNQNGKVFLGDGMNDVYGINNSGVISGMRRNGSNLLVPSVWYSSEVYSDLGTFGGIANGSAAVNGSGEGINEKGHVVGFTRNAENTNYDAFVWYGTDSIQNLNALQADYSPQSYAISINENDQIIGFFGSFGEEDYHAFIWDSINGMRDLNSLLPEGSGWSCLRIARGINDYGQIVGEGYINGQARAFLMTPIPEPATSSLFVFGVIILFQRKLCRMKS